jgi:predicted alpha/beta hydrolase family esterase
MNVIIVHGSNSSEEDSKEGKPENKRHWMPWLKKNLENEDIDVSNKLYPEDWNPNYSDWKRVFEKNKIDEKTILVGHSAGCGFLLRWLGEKRKKVNKLILVAPAVIPSERWMFINNLLNFEIKREVVDFVNKITIFVSNNDSKEILKSVEVLSNLFNIPPVKLLNKGHFTSEDMGTDKFPELLCKILE